MVGSDGRWIFCGCEMSRRVILSRRSENNLEAKLQDTWLWDTPPNKHSPHRQVVLVVKKLPANAGDI